MASLELMKERARIAGRFNLATRRNSKYRKIVDLVAFKSNGECRVVPAAPIEKVNDVVRRSLAIADGFPVVVVTEVEGQLYAKTLHSTAEKVLDQKPQGVVLASPETGITEAKTLPNDVNIGDYLKSIQGISDVSNILEEDYLSLWNESSHEDKTEANVTKFSFA